MRNDQSREPEYSFNVEHGQLFFGHGRDARPVGDIDVAFSFTTDDDGACLHKHGPFDAVAKHAAKIRLIDETVTVVRIPWEAFLDDQLRDAVIDEMNACLAISGRVGRLQDRLEEIGSHCEIDIDPIRDVDRGFSP